jgi:hypothetical protein
MKTISKEVHKVSKLNCKNKLMKQNKKVKNKKIKQKNNNEIKCNNN